MAEQKVATEVAEQEFARWAESMDLDFDPKGWTDDEKRKFRDQKNRLIRSIERGHLVIETDGRMVFRPQASDDDSPITFSEPNGGMLSEMDSKKETATQARGRALIAAVTGQNEVRFATMAMRDFKICDTIVSLFLAG